MTRSFISFLRNPQSDDMTKEEPVLSHLLTLFTYGKWKSRSFTIFLPLVGATVWSSQVRRRLMYVSRCWFAPRSHNQFRIQFERQNWVENAKYRQCWSSVYLSRFEAYGQPCQGFFLNIGHVDIPCVRFSTFRLLILTRAGMTVFIRANQMSVIPLLRTDIRPFELVFRNILKTLAGQNSDVHLRVTE